MGFTTIQQPWRSDVVLAPGMCCLADPWPATHHSSILEALDKCNVDDLLPRHLCDPSQAATAESTRPSRQIAKLTGSQNAWNFGTSGSCVGDLRRTRLVRPNSWDSVAGSRPMPYPPCSAPHRADAVQRRIATGEASTPWTAASTVARPCQLWTSVAMLYSGSLSTHTESRRTGTFNSANQRIFRTCRTRHRVRHQLPEARPIPFTGKCGQRGE